MRRRAAAWLATSAYVLLVVLSHDQVQEPALRLQEALGYRLVHGLLLGVSGLAAVVLALQVRRRLRAHPARRRLTAAWIAAAVLALATMQVLMIRSIEVAHFVQYGVLAVCLTLLLRRPVTAVVVAVLVGFADEAWQYAILHPWQGYFDFNDVVMNAVGALAGATGAMTWKPWTPVPDDRPKAAVLWVACILVAVTALGTGIVSTHAGDGAAFTRYPAPEPDAATWTWHRNSWGKRWLQLSPVQGLLLASLVPATALLLPSVLNENRAGDASGP